VSVVLKSDARKWSEHTRSAGPGFHSFFVTGSILRTATRHFCLKSAFFGNKCPPFLFRQQGTQQYCGILRCTGQNNQLTVINAHVGYVLFTVVMTTFTVAPSSGVPYADALFFRYVSRWHEFTCYGQIWWKSAVGKLRKIVSLLRTKRSRLHRTRPSPPFCYNFANRAQNFLNVFALDLCMHCKFGLDWLRFAWVIPERLIFRTPKVVTNLQ